MRKLVLVFLTLALPALFGFRFIGPGGQYISSSSSSSDAYIVALRGPGAQAQGVELERFETSGRAQGGLGWYVNNSGGHTLAVSGGRSWRVSMEEGAYVPPAAKQAPPPPAQMQTYRQTPGPARVARDDLDRSGVEWPQSRARYTGRQDETTKPYGFPAGQYILEYRYTGGRHFSVWMHSRRGMKELLINRIGKLQGAVEVPIPKDDVIWFEVSSPFGNWEITFERKR